MLGVVISGVVVSGVWGDFIFVCKVMVEVGEII